MLRPQFVVLEADGLWKIRHDGVNYGPYRTQRAAILAAIDAADRTPKSAYESRVMVQSRLRGKVYVEWTYGEPYPADFAYYRASLAEARNDLGRRKIVCGVA
ncbi:MAG TPA: DUF2188 domain-containing protein [Blastocatellia bacterium]|nr:DUF2188 domain-containing protein [Blastocatellia bacterium]